jgi:pimeloyl-ACP methyl ester carboxylesterase
MNAAIRFLAGQVRRATPTQDVNRLFDERQTFGERLADKVAAIGGSWGFIVAFGLFLGAWAVLNTVVLVRHAFDPFPFIFLNLMLSMLATARLLGQTTGAVVVGVGFHLAGVHLAPTLLAASAVAALAAATLSLARLRSPRTVPLPEAGKTILD